MERTTETPTSMRSILVGNPEAAGEPFADYIFRRARDAWNPSNLPNLMEYTVVVRVRKGNVWLWNHYRGYYSGIDNGFKVSRFSDEEHAHPFVSHGINVDLVLGLGNQTAVLRRLSSNPTPTDFLGYPKLSPRYSFGLQRLRDSPEPDSSDSDLTVIGRVRVDAKIYQIRFIGEDTIADRRSYHLALWPLRDPTKYRLREMWVDESDYSTQRITVAGNFSDGPALGVPWTITFKTIGGVQYLDTEHANAAISEARHLTYDDYSIVFEDFRVVDHGFAPLATFSLPDDGGELKEPD